MAGAEGSSSGVLIAWGLFRYRMLNIVPIARETIIDNVSDLVIVLDPENRIVDLNPAAQSWIGHSLEDGIGASWLRSMQLETSIWRGPRPERRKLRRPAPRVSGEKTRPTASVTVKLAGSTGRDRCTCTITSSFTSGRNQARTTCRPSERPVRLCCQRRLHPARLGLRTGSCHRSARRSSVVGHGTATPVRCFSPPGASNIWTYPSALIYCPLHISL